MNEQTMTEKQLKELIALAYRLRQTIKDRNMFMGTIDYNMEVLTGASELIGYILSFENDLLPPHQKT